MFCILFNILLMFVVVIFNAFLPFAVDSSQSHIFVDGQSLSSTSPGVPHLRFNRRASEASLASQVSGLADAYTASNIATSKKNLCFQSASWLNDLLT